MKTKITLNKLAETFVWIIIALYSGLIIILGLAANETEIWGTRDWTRAFFSLVNCGALIFGFISLFFAYLTVSSDEGSKIKSTATAWLSGVENYGIIGKTLIYGAHLAMLAFPFYQYSQGVLGYAEPTFYYKWVYLTFTPLWVASIFWVLARAGRNVMLLLSLINDGKLRRWELSKKA